ncbi:MAG: hypothetical protein LBU86_01525 [Oscillospiraceae bacterium]|nr:hypothetical protein [Oscillospiraceae bacterium]
MTKLFRNFFDSHVRPNNSPGGQHAVVYLAEQAEMAGITGIALLDYIDCGLYRELDCKTRIAQTVMDVARAGAGFRRRMILTRGVELSVRPENYSEAQEAAALCPYDLVSAACHFDPGEGIPAGEEAQALLRRCFDELDALCGWGGFDVLTGLTRPLEWAATQGIPFDPVYFEERIAGALSILTEKGKGLMLNMSDHPSPLGEIIPPLKIIKRYKELGGELVTIGSGACRAEDLGAGVQSGMNILLEAGYGSFAFFRARKPQLLRII